MVAIVQAFMDVLAILWTFAETYLVPATAADITIIHVAIWVPVVLGLLALVFGTIRGLFAGRGKKKA